MFKQIHCDEAEQLMQSHSTLVIADVRDRESYEAAHIRGAVHLSMPLLKAFVEQYDKARPLLLYCFHGISSQSVAQHLLELGFTEVYSLIGGFEAWKIYQPTAIDSNID